MAQIEIFLESHGRSNYVQRYRVPPFRSFIVIWITRGYSFVHVYIQFVYKRIFEQYEFLIQNTFLHKNTPSDLLALTT